MANTYTQIHLQVVFSVKNRQSLIGKEWEDHLYKYITTIIQNHDHKVLRINGMPDHIHILFGMRPTQALSDLMKQLKQASSKWINEQGFLEQKFSWQSGYGAFSYSKQEVPRIINYIKKQKDHHATKNFIREYERMLEDNEIEFDKRYIFQEVV